MSPLEAILPTEQTGTEQPRADQPGADQSRADQPGTGAPTAGPGLGYSLLGALAAAAGFSAANIYYNQAMLGLLGREFAGTGGSVSSIPILTQTGYALGLLFLSPLGDRLERRSLILFTTLALIVSLAGAALAPSLVWLAIASLAIGVFATVAQQVVPMAAALAPVETRGRVVGTVMSGLLLGILGARAISGYVSDLWGWRTMFWIAAALMLAMGAVLAARLPRVAPTIHTSYPRLLASLVELMRRHRVLRQAMLVQALLFASFVAFWSTLGLMLAEPPFELGGKAVGLISLAAIGGALAAPLTGRLADKRGPAVMVTLGAGLVATAFAIFGLVPGSMIALVVGTVVLDLGVQAALISNQARIYALDHAARSRLNTVFMTGMFVGGAIGAAAVAVIFAHLGWVGTCLLGFSASGLALLVSLRKPHLL